MFFLHTHTGPQGEFSITGETIQPSFLGVRIRQVDDGLICSNILRLLMPEIIQNAEELQSPALNSTANEPRWSKISCAIPLRKAWEDILEPAGNCNATLNSLSSCENLDVVNEKTLPWLVDAERRK